MLRTVIPVTAGNVNAAELDFGCTSTKIDAFAALKCMIVYHAMVLQSVSHV